MALPFGSKGLRNNYQEGGGAVKREGGAQCKLTALRRGGRATCKFLGKWCGGGGATEKLTLRFNSQRYFTQRCIPYFPDLFNTNSCKTLEKLGGAS